MGILFDAEEEETLDNELNISWIGSSEKPNDLKNKKEEKTKSKQEKVPLCQYLENKYEQKMSKLQQQIQPKSNNYDNPIIMHLNYIMNLQTMQQVNHLNKRMVNNQSFLPQR